LPPLGFEVTLVHGEGRCQRLDHRGDESSSASLTARSGRDLIVMNVRDLVAARVVVEPFVADLLLPRNFGARRTWP
jgi:hypothetical protein